MKALFILILLLGTGYAGYQYAYQPLVVDAIGIAKSTKPSVAPPVDPDPVVAPVVVEHKELPKIAPKPVVLIPVEKQPVISVAADLGRQGKEANGFQPPEFPTIEARTKNWTELPESIFTHHQEVELKKSVDLKNGAEVVTLKAGSKAIAVGQNGNNVIVSSDTTPGKGEVPLDDTDLKQIISDIYAGWKVTQTDSLRRQFAAAKLVAEKQSEFGKKKVIAGPVNNNKPSRGTDGSYAVLLESMKLGQVREITPQNIKKWGDVQQETIDGKDYWTVVVSYATKTMFGDFNVDAQARIFNGKVEKWVYTGSGEVVP